MAEAKDMGGVVVGENMTFMDASEMASGKQVWVWGHMMVSTPARRKTSMMSAISFGRVTIFSTDLLLAWLQWV